MQCFQPDCCQTGGCRALRWEKYLLANWLLEFCFWSPVPFFGRQLATGIFLLVASAILGCQNHFTPWFCQICHFHWYFCEIVVCAHSRKTKNYNVSNDFVTLGEAGM